MRWQILMLVSALFMTACTEKRIDSTTEETLRRSIESVSSSLGEEEREQFWRATEYLAGVTGHPESSPVRALNLPTGHIPRHLHAVLHGKTAQEIIAESLRISIERRTRLERKIAQLHDLLDREQADPVALRPASPVACRFRVLASRFFFRSEDDSLMYQPIIELTVINYTGRWVHKAYLEGTLTSPGFTVPWIEGAFSFAIPKGVEPGTTASFQLAPNLVGVWGEAPYNRDDMILHLTPYQVEDIVGEPLIPGTDTNRLRTFHDTPSTRIDVTAPVMHEQSGDYCTRHPNCLNGCLTSRPKHSGPACVWPSWELAKFSKTRI